MKGIIVFFLFVCLFSSCKRSRGSVYSDDITEEYIRKVRLIFATPDSLRSADEQELFEHFEEAMWAGVVLKDHGYALKYEIIGNKEEWKKKGLPEIYYELIQQDIACNNEGLLDTAKYNKQLVLEAFFAKQIEVRNKQANRKK